MEMEDGKTKEKVKYWLWGNLSIEFLEIKKQPEIAKNEPMEMEEGKTKEKVKYWLWKNVSIKLTD